MKGRLPNYTITWQGFLELFSPVPLDGRARVGLRKCGDRIAHEATSPRPPPTFSLSKCRRASCSLWVMDHLRNRRERSKTCRPNVRYASLSFQILYIYVHVIAQYGSGWEAIVTFLPRESLYIPLSRKLFVGETRSCYRYIAAADHDVTLEE